MVVSEETRTGGEQAAEIASGETGAATDETPWVAGTRAYRSPDSTGRPGTGSRRRSGTSAGTGRNVWAAAGCIADTAAVLAGAPRSLRTYVTRRRRRMSATAVVAAGVSNPSRPITRHLGRGREVSSAFRTNRRVFIVFVDDGCRDRLSFDVGYVVVGLVTVKGIRGAIRIGMCRRWPVERVERPSDERPDDVRKGWGVCAFLRYARGWKVGEW